MEIKLKKICLSNFKGIRNLDVNFNDDETNILGENGTGKTTIFDAFTWLLFDKDSHDRKNFEIKTLDENNEAIHNLEHIVSGILTIDSHEIELKKVYKEKWTKKKGEEQSTFTGHETNYYWNDVPISKSEYESKINGVIDEKMFKLITNPLYFNASIKDNERRETLIGLIGDFNPQDIIAKSPTLTPLVPLFEKYTFEELKSRTTEKRKLANKKLQEYPTRIDEANKSLNIIVDDISSIDTIDDELVQQTIDDIQQQLDSQDKLIQTAKDSATISEERKHKLHQYEISKKRELEDEYQSNIHNQKRKEGKKSELRTDVNDLGMSLKHYQEQIDEQVKAKKHLADEWLAISKETFEFNPEHTICPTCEQKIPDEKLSTLEETQKEHWTIHKKNELLKLQDQGNKANEKINELNSKIVETNENIKGKQVEIAQLDMTKNDEAQYGFSKDYDFSMDEQWKILSSNVNIAKPPISISEEVTANVQRLKSELKIQQEKLNSIEIVYSKSTDLEKIKGRIKELEDEEKEISHKVLEYDKLLFLLDEFTKIKVNLITKEVDNMFELVKFKMFDTQVNGGIVECCECMIDGVPFSDLNTASKINGGLDIIKTFANYYDQYAPIFIDNKESINEIIKMNNTQIINLVVSKDEKINIQ